MERTRGNDVVGDLTVGSLVGPADCGTRGGGLRKSFMARLVLYCTSTSRLRGTRVLVASRDV